MYVLSQTNPKLFHAGGLKPRGVPSGTAILVSAVRRRYGQIRFFIFTKSVPCKGDTTRWKGKLKQGQKTAFPFPLMVSPLQTSSLNPYSLPFFIPLHFACRWRQDHVHLFVPFSIAMFTGFNFTPFFYLGFFCLFESKFIRMSSPLYYRILCAISSICG